MKVCLLALNIYPMLSGDYRSRKAGGAELQQLAIAESLTRRGHEVFVVCLDHGQPDGERIGNVVVHKAFRENSGIPLVRFFHPGWTSVWSALKRADCDVYYCRTATFHPGLLRIFRAATGKPYVFAGALDTDFMPGMASIGNFRDRYLYEFGLRGANAIIVQSGRQQELLAQHYGLDGTVIGNFLNEPRKPLPAERRRLILWVSTIRNRKRPMHFVRLAERFPDEQFVMVGGRLETHGALYDEVEAASRRLPNLEFLGFQPYERVEALFDECKVFVNTSLYEGFPNTFLQAWRREVPVVSFLDPDDVIRRNDLGRIADTEDDLGQALEAVCERFDRYQHVGDYYLAHHSSRVGDRLCRLLEQTVSPERVTAAEG